MKIAINKNLLEIKSAQADLITLSQRISKKAEYIEYILITLDIKQDNDNSLQDIDQAARELQENAQELQRAADNISTASKEIRSQAFDLRLMNACEMLARACKSCGILPTPDGLTEDTPHARKLDKTGC